MPKTSLNIDAHLLAWLDAEAKNAKCSRTDVVVALVKAAMAAGKEHEEAEAPPPAIDPQERHGPQACDIRRLQVTLDLFYQRYITDNPDPNIELSPDDRWARIVMTREKISAGSDRTC